MCPFLAVALSLLNLRHLDRFEQGFAFLAVSSHEKLRLTLVRDEICWDSIFVLARLEG